MSEPVTIAVLAGLAGVLALDATAALQAMVSQPMVAGALAGVLTGQPLLGLTTGGILQLAWLGALPVGAAGFPDAPVGAVAGVGAASMLAATGHDIGWCVGLGVGWGIVVGAIGHSVVVAVRRFNVLLYERTAAGTERADGGVVARAVGLALLVRFAVAAALAAAALAVAWPVARLAALPAVGNSFPGFVWAAPMAAAVLARRSRGNTELALLAAGFAAGLVVVALT